MKLSGRNHRLSNYLGLLNLYRNQEMDRRSDKMLNAHVKTKTSLRSVNYYVPIWFFMGKKP